MEKRYNATEVRADGGKIKGTASPTYDGTPGTEYPLWEGTVERFAPGAFDAHLSAAPDVVALVNHDPSLILGRTPDTLKLRSDKNGLHYEIDPPETQAGKDVMVSIRRGDLRGSSFAFKPTDIEWARDGNKDVRLIRAAKLFDVSVVTTPAYSGSSVGVRSEERHDLERERDDYRARLETEKRLKKLEEILNKK